MAKITLKVNIILQLQISNVNNDQKCKEIICLPLVYNQHPTLADFSFDAHSPLFVFSIKHLLGFGFTVLVCWIRVRLTLTLQRSGLLVWYLRHAYFAFSPFRLQVPTNISCKLSTFIWLNLICLIGQLDLFIPFSKTD